MTYVGARVLRGAASTAVVAALRIHWSLQSKMLEGQSLGISPRAVRGLSLTSGGCKSNWSRIAGLDGGAAGTHNNDS